MVDQAHAKETEARETIQKLKQEINNLSKLVEQSAGFSMGQEHRREHALTHVACKLGLTFSLEKPLLPRFLSFTKTNILAMVKMHVRDLYIPL